MSVKSKPLGTEWKRRLDLVGRKVPEIYEHVDEVRGTPHAGAIRTTLDKLCASAVFCVQGVPTVAILLVDDYDRNAIIDLHAALWNQGLASLLLVISGDTVRAFSLARTPYVGLDEEFDRRCLVQELDAISDALALKEIIYGVESGRLWSKHANYFDPKERIDQVLLTNLTESHQLLCDAGLSSDSAQALLIQAMFIAYLEDRQIVGDEYFLGTSNNAASTFSALLDIANVRALNRLFESLRADFNGDLFVAPCSFDASGPRPRLNRSHLEVLSRFRSGREEMASGAGQYRFWGYDFKYIPIELISAVYDRFLGEKEAERREQGAYYTPMFLADTVISQVWDTLPSAVKDKGEFLDPACGSGVFLVRSFQRLCEHWRETRTSRTIRWDSLLAILSRLQGWDLNGGAVRVAVFSLYIALLEEVSPPDIRLLIERGKLLPELWGRNLRQQDFFTVSEREARFDVVIGNPPWTSRRGPARSSVTWCAEHRLPMPSKEDAWAFTWKSLRHLKKDGIVAFLLPARGFLHAEKSIAARDHLMSKARVHRIINFADLRFQLFEGAVGPAALIILGAAEAQGTPYKFDYWAPKADLNLQIKRLITLGSSDRRTVNSKTVTADPLVFKRLLWMRAPEEKLFNYLSSFPRLSSFIDQYGNQSRRSLPSDTGWVIGQGFKRASTGRRGSSKYNQPVPDDILQLPHLDIDGFSILAISKSRLRRWTSKEVHRVGFRRGYEGTRILIPQGIGSRGGRVRAAIAQNKFTFLSTLQAISVPPEATDDAKLLCSLLNSNVMAWFAFQNCSYFGTEREKILQSEILDLPFPRLSDLPDARRTKRATKKLIDLVNEALHSSDSILTSQDAEMNLLREIDKQSYEYFCLSADEIILIEDTMNEIVPSVQPRQSNFPDIWEAANASDRKDYATTLVRSMSDWFGGDYAVGVSLEARNDDLAVLRLTLNERHEETGYVERNDRSVGEAIADLFKHIHQPLSGNFQLMPDFRIFIRNNLYLVKPTQRRFWLKSTALADADSIALDLHDATQFSENRSHA